MAKGRFRFISQPIWGRVHFLVIAVMVTGFIWGAMTIMAQQPAGSGSREIGTVKEITGTSMLLRTDSGAEIKIQLQESTRLLRVEPGQMDLKSATPISIPEIQVGDRVLIRGKASEDGKSLAASMVVAIKKEAIEQKQAREREDWQKRGLSGLVKAVDSVTHSITITTSALTGRKPVVVHLPPQSILRRYAPDSVRFDDSKVGKFEDIKPGDQFRGRGQRSEDGTTFTADEIITGSFRSIAGTISAVDPSAKTLTIADLISRQPVIVRITGESSMHVLPAMMAEGIATRVRGGESGGPNGGSPPGANSQGQPPTGPPPAAGPPPGGPPGGWQGRANSEGGHPSVAAGEPGRMPGGPPGNGQQDFQSMIAKLPAATFAEFSKGEAVVIVAAPGKEPGQVTAINVVGGVEPLLRATPGGGEPMLLSPWSLGGSAPEGGGGGGPAPQPQN